MPRPPDRRAAALADEQQHVDRVYARIETLRRRARERAEAAAADRGGSTFQARFERDVVAHHEASRSARFTFGDREAVVFGRLDRAAGDTLHIGRISVLAEDREALLVDWRAPAAAPFYQATPADPMGVARRRTLVTDGPVVRDLDDEVLDTEAADRLGLESVTGQGALLAALERSRTGYMQDIVATIQADQDRIIRLPDRGTVVVTGGPGTGKTVVALHRIAYLLYTHRTRFEGRGVLVVGPSTAFTQYIARVLPSLGENQAVLRALGGFAPESFRVEGWDDLEVAELKGRLEMTAVVRRALELSLPPIPPETRVTFDGVSTRVTAAALRSSRDRLLRRLRPDEDGHRYHELAPQAEDALRSTLWRQWRRQAAKAGHRVPDQRVASGFDVSVAESAGVEMLRRCFWPRLDPVELFERFRRELVEPAATGPFDAGEVEILRRAWSRADRGVVTVDDVPLLDEFGALIGSDRQDRAEGPEPEREASPFHSDRFQVVRPTVDATAGDYRDFAHVVVDEAQDLSPMQWRMVSRRGPYASWTVVGDLAQRSRVTEPSSWDDIARLIGRRHVEIARLHVNYRTPDEVIQVARAVLERAGLDPTVASEAVRSSGAPPRLVRTSSVVATAAELAVEHTDATDGTVAVIADDRHLPELRAAVDERLSELEPERRDAVAARLFPLDPRTAKGLEFDEVVVAGPDTIAASSAVGWHLLYVAVTRATRTLTVVASPDADVPGRAHFETVTVGRRAVAASPHE